MNFSEAFGYLKTIRRLRKQLAEKEKEIAVLQKDNKDMYEHVRDVSERLMEVL